MKIRITFIMLLFFQHLFATTYYVDKTGGNNSNTGLSPAQAWQTVAKTNGFTFASGDSILFKRGEKWAETVRPPRNNLRYSAYGTGVKPEINGLVTLTGWTDEGAGTIWYVTNASIKNDVNMFLINRVPKEVARTPNAGRGYVYSSSTSTQLTSTSVPLASVGEQVIKRDNHWRADRVRITAISGNVMTFTNAGTINPSGSQLGIINGTANYGWYRQRCNSCVDTTYEWFKDSTNNHFRVYFGAVNPTSVTAETSIMDTGFNVNSRTDISIENFKVIGCNVFGAYVTGGSTVKFKNCYFYSNTTAIFVNQTDDITIQLDSFKYNNCQAINLSNSGRVNSLIESNFIDSTSPYFGLALQAYDPQMTAINVVQDSDRVGNTNIIRFNTITNTGASNIKFQGSNFTVSKNFCSYPCKWLDDQGNIYTFLRNDTGAITTSRYFYNRVVDSNFCFNNLGATLYTATGVGPDAVGIYFDDRSPNITATGNVIYNIAGTGIQVNNTVNTVFRSNLIYNASYMTVAQQKNYSNGCCRFSGFRQTYNTMYPLYNSKQLNYQYVDGNLLWNTPATITQSMRAFGFIDSNYLYTPVSTGFNYYYSSTGTGFTFPPNINLATWRGTYLHDINSRTPPVTPTAIRFEYNYSSSPRTVTFTGLSYITPDGTVYNNSAVIPAYTAKLLIPNGVPPTPPPTTLQSVKTNRRAKVVM